MSILELQTPFPTVDLDAVDRNVARMQAYCDEHGLALRPHVKTHKLPRIARLQLDAGARGITCQKLGEAELMADAGFDDILITFPLIGTGKAERLAALAARANVTVGADSAVVARGPLARARAARRGDRLPRRLRHGLRAHRRAVAGARPPSSRSWSTGCRACASPV